MTLRRKIVSLTLCLLLLFVATAAASLLLQSKISEHSQEWWMAKRRDCRVTSASAPGQISKTHRCGSTSLATTGSRSAASPPSTIDKGEVAVASMEELQAARLSSKRLWGCGMRFPVSSSRRRSVIGIC